MSQHRRRSTKSRAKSRRSKLQSTTSTAFHGFPPEMLLRIFNMAAAASQTTCLALCRVSSWSRRLALPHLFVTPVIWNTGKLQLFASAVETAVVFPGGESKPSENLVRGVWIHSNSRTRSYYQPHWPHVHNWIRTCPKLVHIAADHHILDIFTVYTSQISVSYPAQILRLTVIGEVPQWAMLVSRLNYYPTRGITHALRGITHINFLSVDSYASQLNISPFPLLTPFAIPVTRTLQCRTSVDPFAVFAPLLEKPDLEMLVLVVYARDRRLASTTLDVAGWVRKTRRTDPRVFILEQYARKVKDDWRTEASGGDGIWEKAVAFTRDMEASDSE